MARADANRPRPRTVIIRAGFAGISSASNGMLVRVFSPLELAMQSTHRFHAATVL